MRNSFKTVGLLTLFWLAKPCGAETIAFSDSRQNADAAIHVTPTGPDNLPIDLGQWEVLGGAAPFLNNSVTSRYYSAVVTFDNPVSSVSLDVVRANNSAWDNPITLVAYDHGKPVAQSKTNIVPLGDTSHISLSAPAIDKIEWSGSGWVFHPYQVRDLQVSFASAVSAPAITPSVGTAVPEPAAFGLFSAVGLLFLCRRPRSRA